jgi:hypothetical protein
MEKLSGSRAQLFIVGALLLAVIFVTLAVVINGAIFTENLATRTSDTTATEALEGRHQIAENLGSIMRSVNADSYPSGGFSTAEGAMENSIDQYSADAGYLRASNGPSMDVDHVSHVQGKHVEISSGGDFSSVGGNDWTVTSTTESRQFTVDVDRTSLGEDVTDGTWNEFIIVLRSSSDRWNVHIGTDGSGNEIIRVTRGDQNGADPTYITPVNSEGICTLPAGASDVKIDISEGTVGGRPCQPLDKIWWSANNVNTGLTYDVEIKNGDEAEGTGSILIEDGASVPVLSSTDAVYSTTINYRYDSPSVTYETELTVAPGEQND